MRTKDIKAINDKSFANSIGSKKYQSKEYNQIQEFREQSNNIYNWIHLKRLANDGGCCNYDCKNSIRYEAGSNGRKINPLPKGYIVFNQHHSNSIYCMDCAEKVLLMNIKDFDEIVAKLRNKIIAQNELFQSIKEEVKLHNVTNAI